MIAEVECKGYLRKTKCEGDQIKDGKEQGVSLIYADPNLQL